MSMINEHLFFQISIYPIGIKNLSKCTEGTIVLTKMALPLKRFGFKHRTALVIHINHEKANVIGQKF